MLGETAAQVSWRYGAFELDPNVPSEGVDARAYMKGRYAPDMIAEMHGRLERLAHDEGLPMRDLAAESVRPNTFDAHRLLAAALQQGEAPHEGETLHGGAAARDVSLPRDGAVSPTGAALQQALADELFAAFWMRGENVGLRGILGNAAAADGMPAAAAAAVLGGDDFAAAVRAEEQLAAEIGIRAVPTFVIADRLLVSGAQPPLVLAGAVREALT